jgi:hypothetical protein
VPGTVINLKTSNPGSEAESRQAGACGNISSDNVASSACCDLSSVPSASSEWTDATVGNEAASEATAAVKRIRRRNCFISDLPAEHASRNATRQGYRIATMANDSPTLLNRVIDLGACAA